MKVSERRFEQVLVMTMTSPLLSHCSYVGETAEINRGVARGAARVWRPFPALLAAFGSGCNKSVQKWTLYEGVKASYWHMFGVSMCV